MTQQKPRIGVFAACLAYKLLLSFAGRLLRSPGFYALIVGPVAVFAVFSPRAAPDWFAVLCLIFGVPALILALWTGLTLGVMLRRYRAEVISFDHAVRGLARTARGFFRAGQLGALAFAFGLAAVCSLVFPGLGVLAGLLVPVLAVALSVLPGAVHVPHHADAGLALVVPPGSFPLGSDSEDRFRIAWRFAARMGAVRAAVADRQAVLTPEARDISKALDGGGMVRPPVNRLPLDPIGGLWLRGRGAAAVLSAALPIALAAWLLAALMPLEALPALPRPGDLWAFATSEDPPSADAPSAPEDEPAEDPPGQDSLATSSDSTSNDAGGGEPGADNASGGQGTDAGSSGVGQGGEGQPGGASAGSSGNGQEADAGPGGASETGGASADGSGDGQGTDAGSDGAGQSGEGQPGGTSAGGSGDGPGTDAGSDGAGKGGEGQTGGASADDASGGQGTDAGSDGAGQSGEGQPGGTSADDASDGQGTDAGSDGAGQGAEGQPGGASAGGSGDGQGADAESGGAGEIGGGQAGGVGGDVSRGIAGGTDGSATNGSDPDDGTTAGDPVATSDPAGNREIMEDGSAGDSANVIVFGSGQGTNVEGRVLSHPAAEGGEDLEIGMPPSLFAPSGSAPPAVLQDLSPEAVTEMSPGTDIPPRQRLPAWIADLYQ